VLNAIGTVIYFALLFSSDAACSAELDRLLALHDSYGLLHPPKDASLVLFTANDNYKHDSSEKRIFGEGPTLGFSQDGRTVLNELGKPFKVTSITIIKPDPTALKEDVRLGDIDDAVLYHARGWKALARTTFRKWLVNSLWTPDSDLQYRAWNYWIHRLRHDPDTPLATVAKRLKQVYPHFVGTGFARGQRALLKSLDLALKPRNAKPGSDEALIDALIEARGWEPFASEQMEGFRLDPRYRALLRRGLDAVPALLAHIGDDRLVRGYSNVCGCMNDLRVRHIVFDILMQMNGGMIIEGWRGGLDCGVPKEWPEEIGNWYAEARKLGEEKHILSRILGEDEDDEQFRPGLLWLLAEKYPQHLPEVFRKAIDTRKKHVLFAWEYVKIIAESRIPNADKQKILEYAAKQDNPNIRAAGIYYLRRLNLNPKFAKEQLLLGLAKISDHPQEQNAGLAFIVAEGSDPDEWKAFLRAFRANEDTRLELLCAVLCAKTPEGHKHRLAFLTEYLNDIAKAEVSAELLSQAEAPHAVAMQFAALLKIDTDDHKNHWSAAQWSELRARVRAKLKEELKQ
jgi:hypothetical protein